MKKLLFLFFSILFSFSLFAQSDTEASTEEVEMTDEEFMAAYRAYSDSVCATFTYQTGTVTLRNDIATLEVPPGFKYLDGESSNIVLTHLWGNPPPDSEEDGSFGMLFPEHSAPNDTNDVYAIDITFSKDGYVDDSDAKDLDYDELLEQMQSDEAEINAARIEMGYEPVNIVGWASPPFYDAENKKLHWAKELRFGEATQNTLNYNIRILGRKGYLMLNVIGEMSTLPQVKTDIDPILASIEFNEGHRYRDFDPSIDEVAAVGIGGLIAGKVLAKAGILAKVGVLLAKFWKVILIAIVGLGAGIRRFFGGKSDEGEAPAA